MRRTKDRAELLELSRDAGTVSLMPALAYHAEDEGEVSAAVREAISSGLSVTPRGAGTGIPTQSVGRGAILIQERGHVRLEGTRAFSEPGVVKSDLNRILLNLGRWMPVDPSSYASCTVGGMVANNSSGVRTPKYGSTIDYVEGLRMVGVDGAVRTAGSLAAEDALSGDHLAKKVAGLLIENKGAILSEAPKVTKNSSGYRLDRAVHGESVDFAKLFVGSEGTLGVVTEATFSTRERPSWRLLLIVESTLEELDGTAALFRRQSPTALELVDKSVFQKVNRVKRISRYSRSESQYLLFCEFDGNEGGAAEKAETISGTGVAGLDPMVITGSSEIQDAWDARNESLAIAQDIRDGTKFPLPGVEDLVVPPERLGDMVGLLADQFAKRDLDYILYGHAGDSNLHARPILDPASAGGRRGMDELMEDCFEGVWRMGGSMTGEHGDGMLRAKFVERQYPKTYWIMREVKDIFDPKRMLNPGVKIL